MTALRHVGIVVGDLDRALHFYRDLLGFNVAVDADESGDFLDAILAISKARVRTVKLKGSDGAIVELLAFSSPAPDCGPSPTLVRRGPTHIAVTVQDLEGLHARMSSAGVKFTTPPRTSPDGKAKVTFCQDPDGTYVELVQVS